MTDNRKIQSVNNALARVTDPQPRGSVRQPYNQSSSGFLKLPPELRNGIYRLNITPHILETHVTQGHAPALLKVSRQVSSEFASLYYSSDFMAVEFYDRSTKTWEIFGDFNTSRAMLGEWLGYFVVETVGTIKTKKREVEERKPWRAKRAPEVAKRFREGVLSWYSGYEGFPAAACIYYSDALKP